MFREHSRDQTQGSFFQIMASVPPNYLPGPKHFLNHIPCQVLGVQNMTLSSSKEVEVLVHAEQREG